MNPPPPPHLPYGRSKLAAEQALDAGAGALSVLHLRLTAVYGPGDRETLALFRMASRGAFSSRGRGPPHQMLFVEDAVEAVRSSLAAVPQGPTLCAPAPVHLCRSGAGPRPAVGRRVSVLPVPALAVRLLGAASQGLGVLVRRPTMSTRERPAKARTRMGLLHRKGADYAKFACRTDFRKARNELSTGIASIAGCRRSGRDLFQKCRDYKDVEQIQALGLYAYFRCISSARIRGRHDGKTVVMRAPITTWADQPPPHQRAGRRRRDEVRQRVRRQPPPHGTLDIHVELEEKLAARQKGAALVSPPGSRPTSASSPPSSARAMCYIDRRPRLHHRRLPPLLRQGAQVQHLDWPLEKLLLDDGDSPAS